MAAVPFTTAYSTCLTSLTEITLSVSKFRLLRHAPKAKKTIAGILLRVSEVRSLNKYVDENEMLGEQ